MPDTLTKLSPTHSRPIGRAATGPGTAPHRARRCGVAALAALLSLSVPCARAAAQQHVVVPAAYEHSEAIAFGWIAGASRDVRQQTLIGASHLGQLVGRTLTALELRRHLADEIYAGGTADLTVSLSIAQRTPLDCSNEFADNADPGAITVFSGPVTLPTSPAATGTTVAWSQDNTVRIEFTTPFVYTGGPLCVDIVGHPIAGQNANWWMADLDNEVIQGSTTDLGGGCGTFGGAEKDWSYVSPRTLIPGAYATFLAYGPPGGLALAAFGSRAPVALPLALTGLPSPPECELWLATIDAVMPAVFVPLADPTLPSPDGEAVVSFKVANHPAMFGLTMTTQWLDATWFATSNAIEWSLANTSPTLDLALIEGHPQDAAGVASPGTGHVMRFEFQ